MDNEGDIIKFLLSLTIIFGYLTKVYFFNIIN